MAQTEDNTDTMIIFVKFRTSLNINRFAKCNYAVFIVVMVHDLKNLQMIWYFTCQLSQMTSSHVGTREIVYRPSDSDRTAINARKMLKFFADRLEIRKVFRMYPRGSIREEGDECS